MSSPKIFSEDKWDNIKKRWEAWWSFGLYDRVLLQIKTPKEKLQQKKSASRNKDETLDGWGDRFAVWESRPHKQEEDTAEKQWMDIDYMIKRTLYEIDNYRYFGESIPIFTTNWTFGHALLFGSKIDKITDDAVFIKPLNLEEDPYQILRSDLDGYWWDWLLDATSRAVKYGRNKYFVQPAYGATTGDTLGLLIGFGKALTYIKDNPQWVKRSLDKIADAIIRLYGELFPIVSPSGLEGYINWVGCWSASRNIALDCDIGNMVSEETFKDIFIPSIMKIMDIGKYSIYHLDGTEQLRMLDTLLNIRGLHAIQWAPGVGKEAIMHWVPLVRRIQDKRKSLVLYCTSQEVLPLLKEVRPEGLCLSVSCRDGSEAESLMEKVEGLY